MRRIFAIFVVFLLLISLSACMDFADFRGILSQALTQEKEQIQSIEPLQSSLPQASAAPIVSPSPANTEYQGKLEVRFIDVGQADAALVRCGGQTMLIDGGNVADSSRIVAILKELGITYLDYVVCTHPHEDHVGGLSGALNQARAGKVLCSATEYDTKDFQNFKKYVNKQGLTISVPEAGDSFSVGDAKVIVLGPLINYEDINENSLVLKLIYGDTSFLLMGDAGRDSEIDMLDTYMDLSATVLKVGHHGSFTGTSYVLLNAVMPEMAVISVGKGNDYGHPHEEVLSRLRDEGAVLYRTDECGDIICTSNGYQVNVQTEKYQNNLR